MRAAASGGLCVCVLALNYKSRYKLRSIHMLVHSFEQKHASFYLCFTRIIPFAQYVITYCLIFKSGSSEIKIKVKKGCKYVNLRI